MGQCLLFTAVLFFAVLVLGMASKKDKDDYENFW
jgi:hypothetical protein